MLVKRIRYTEQFLLQFTFPLVSAIPTCSVIKGFENPFAIAVIQHEMIGQYGMVDRWRKISLRPSAFGVKGIGYGDGDTIGPYDPDRIGSGAVIKIRYGEIKMPNERSETAAVVSPLLHKVVLVTGTSSFNSEPKHTCLLAS